MSTEPDYTAAWCDLKRRQLISWAMFLGYVPGVFAIVFGVELPLAALTGIELDYFFYPVAFSWMALAVIAGWRKATFRCPHCHRWFFATWWYQLPFARKCVHCGLPKWANSN
jgi:hypothetical protein